MNTLETRVLQLIGENTASPDVFTDDATGMAQIRDSLNDAIEELSMLSGSVKRSYYMLLRDEQSFYRIGFRQDRFGWIAGAWLHGTKRRLVQTDIMTISTENPRWLKNTGTPLKYGQVGANVFFVWPSPSSEMIVQLDCIVIPERYANDYDRVKLRSIFHDAAVRFAVGEYYASRGDAQQAVYHHNAYMENIVAAGLYPKQNERPYYYKTDKAVTQ